VAGRCFIACGMYNGVLCLLCRAVLCCAVLCCDVPCYAVLLRCALPTRILDQCSIIKQQPLYSFQERQA
jgi:hypothetical protein